ncbi:MAG TPA: MoaD/ThiS family protein [Chthoniobacterales bacterium]|jgi:molybdopterin converting factor small subunit
MPNESKIIVEVRFFAQLRDLVGATEKRLELPRDAKVADLLMQLYAKHPDLKKWDRQILIGAGLEFVGRDHVLDPGEEIAIMPPVQGG